jgi:uncharacterized DUF497 family protein
LIFAWDQNNSSHIAKHGVTPREAEFVVENASPPFPDDVGDGKRRVWGPTSRRRMLQVIYVLKKQSEVSFKSVSPLDWAALQKSPDVKIVRIIHAMDLTDTMNRQLRRRRK